MPNIEDEMRGQMGHWETYTSSLKKQFDYMIEKKFGGSPQTAETLLRIASNLKRSGSSENYESFSLDFVHDNSEQGLSNSLIRLNFFPSDKNMILSISIIGSVEKGVYRTPILGVKKIICSGFDEQVIFLIKSDEKDLLVDVKRGEIFG